MDERRIDPVTFVLGGLSVAAGGVVLSGGSLLHEARILLPVGLIAFGIALLVRVASATGDRVPTPQPSPSVETGTATPDMPDDTDPTPATTDTSDRTAHFVDDEPQDPDDPGQDDGPA